MTHLSLPPVWRLAIIEAVMTECFGPAILLLLRQLFVHEHPATIGPLVNLSISTVMLIGDSLLVIAVTMSTVYYHDLSLWGAGKMLPNWLNSRAAWLRLMIITLPAAYLALIQADPFSDQLALRPHAWIFQWWHVAFGAYVSARLITTACRGIAAVLVHWHRLRRHRWQMGSYYPSPTGSALFFATMCLIVATFWGIYHLHPADFQMTVGWLGVI